MARPQRTTRSNPDPQPTSAPAKRTRRQQTSTTTNPMPTPSSTQRTETGIDPGINPDQHSQTLSVENEDIELSKITLKNYHQAKAFWPLGRIQEQLDKQKSSNHQLSEAVIAEGQAVLQNLEHTLHMIAMVAHVSVIKLKRNLGLLGGSHGENAWHRWLSFALEANKIRSHPDASNMLTARNQANSKTYQALDDDEYNVFTAPIFYALGGYPDYSSVIVTEDENVFGDASILVPEVPKLSPEDEARYRPIYEKLVDLDKVARDRMLNTPAVSTQREERRSLQCFKKIAQHVNYYVIACSNGNSGNGWCREYTSRDEMAEWVSKKAQFEQVFPLFCQHGSTFEAIRDVLAAKNAPIVAQKHKNQSDIDKTALRAKLNNMLKDVVGEALYPTRGFPQVPNPLAVIKERRIPIVVERAPDSAMSEEEFSKGFTAMDTKARRHWLSDIQEGKFTMKKVELAPSVPAINGPSQGGETQSPVANSGTLAATQAESQVSGCATHSS
ncbi:hypothetical protein DFH28DRAFT_904164 [Melampsora americana]|nr:hypothetical protein DFH28DRAFT_904164 [Melampsora americana]